jgi:D-alanine-D-alanine ligase
MNDNVIPQADVSKMQVAVLLGGRSREREVSLKSGAAVLASLQRQGIAATGLDPHLLGHQLLTVLSRYDRVFIALHGREGEDGEIQGILEYLRIPYTGSGVQASAMAMDKSITKRLWRSVGLPTPASYLLDAEEVRIAANKSEALQALVVSSQAAGLSFPWIAKPVGEGSSLGMMKINDATDLHNALQHLQSFSQPVLLEKWITGNEYTVAIVGDKVLPSINIKTTRQFYDYVAKYLTDDTQFNCPSGLSKEDESLLSKLAWRAFHALGCQGWGRVDVIRDQQGEFNLIEVNTIPGLTDHSLVPMAAKAAGIAFDELVLTILQQASLKAPPFVVVMPPVA